MTLQANDGVDSLSRCKLCEVLRLHGHFGGVENLGSVRYDK